MAADLVFPPFYQGYIDRVDGDVFDQLRGQHLSTCQLLRSLSSEQWACRYAPGKWTLWQSWRHVVDTERIMATRALRIIRGDVGPQPGYDQDAYAATYLDTDSPGDLAAEYDAQRRANLLLLGKVDPVLLDQVGIVSNQPMSARALCYILAGHEAHHLALTRERYL